MPDDLQKKLENISAPKIELAGHRQALRRALLGSRHFQPKPEFFWVRRWAPLGAALVLVLFFVSQTIYAKVQESRAMGITRNDAEVQKLDLDFTNIKMAAKPTRLPSSERSAISATSPAVTLSPVPSVAAGAERKDKMMSVEIDDGKLRYTVLVNMTHKKVEKIKREKEENKSRSEENQEDEVEKSESGLNEHQRSFEQNQVSPDKKVSK